MATQFNKDTWLRRIQTRIRRGRVSDGWIDISAIDGIEKVISWLSTRETSVEFVKRSGGYYDENKNTVFISSHLPPRHQLHILLHECGHLLISVSGRWKYPEGYKKIDDDRDGRNVIHKIDVIAEEFDAWHQGFLLAERLDILLHKEEFLKIKAKCLMTYIRWASKKGRVSDD